MRPRVSDQPDAQGDDRALREKAEALDLELEGLDADGRLRRAAEILGDGLIATTSFGRDSGLLLHHLHRLALRPRVYFIDTSFHFPETLAYRDTLVQIYGLRMEERRSHDPDNQRYAEELDGRIRIADVEACCAINKVAVQRGFLDEPSVQGFLTGLRRDQAASRKTTPIVGVQRGRLKICPFADWPAEDVDLYMRLHEVPEHPLAAQGYASIGCAPETCTVKPAPGESRSGRWAGQDKTECGLHLDFGP
jgi:phosphoadenosine phosphosulfate reductase